MPPPPPPLNRFNRKRAVYGFVVASLLMFYFFAYFSFVFILPFSLVCFFLSTCFVIVLEDMVSLHTPVLELAL